jgi:single-stranded DNA-binding protein
MDVRDESNSARVVLIGRVVQSLRRRLTVQGAQTAAGVTAASSRSPVRIR